MSDLYKYGVALHLYKPIIKRGVVDFAVGADWTPAAGDVKISKDGGAAANVTNLPVAITMGNTALWDYSMTATEMQAAKVRITIADAATKAVEDDAFEIDTYGNASAQHLFDLSIATQPVNVIQTAGGAFQTGTVATGGFSPTSTQFECGDITEATASHFVGLSCFVLTGALAKQLIGVVTAYSLIGGIGHFTVSGSPTGESLANTDTVVFI